MARLKKTYRGIVLENAIINCRVYEDLRNTLFRKASECTFNFDGLSDEQKFVFLFSNLI